MQEKISQTNKMENSVESWNKQNNELDLFLLQY